MAASKTRSIIAFLPPWYPTESPHALRRATRARWVASVRATSGSSLDVTPLGGHHVMSGPSTATTRAPSA